MSITHHLRRLALAVFAAGAVTLAVVSASLVTGSLTPAAAQMSEEFQFALEPYGQWRPHPRFGEIWVPARVAPDWRPYQHGHWVYTDDWGWYWVSDEQEADWGWVTFHYGRWAFEPPYGWFWVPGDEWAPAWVDWRYGEQYVGWAPLPPDEMIDAYDDEPANWIFVAPRYLTALRLAPYIVRRDRWATALRATRLVNRTVAVRGPGRIAINAGLPPAYVARVTRAPLPTYRVQPRVFATTRGVAGAVPVRREDLRSPRPGAPRPAPVAVQRTNTVVQPATTVVVPQPLNKGEPGRVGPRVPRAAQGGVAPAQPRQTPPPAAAPAAPPPAAAPRPGALPAAAPPPPAATRPATPPPPPAGAAPVRPQPGPPPQVRPDRPIAPQTPPPPPPQQTRPAAPPRPAQTRPAAPPPPPPPAQVRPAAPPPPAAVRPAAPPPAAARPAAPAPAARPAPPAARPPAAPPPAARPAVPRPAAPARPALKPGEKPPEERK